MGELDGAMPLSCAGPFWPGQAGSLLHGSTALCGGSWDGLLHRTDPWGVCRHFAAFFVLCLIISLVQPQAKTCLLKEPMYCRALLEEAFCCRSGLVGTLCGYIARWKCKLPHFFLVDLG